MSVRLALIATLAFGCHPQEDRAPATPGPPGGSQGGTTPGDGDGDGDGDGGVDEVQLIRGRLCHVADLRFFETCTPSDLSGIDVGIRGRPTSVVRTGARGEFAIEDPGGPVILEVGFDTPGIRDSIIELPAPPDGERLPVQVPTVFFSEWAELVDGLGVIEEAGTASIAINARQNGVPVPGVDVLGPPTSLPPFFDAGSPLEWSQLGLTGTGGAALMFSVNEIDVAPIGLIGPTGDTLDLSPPVVEGALTFATGDFAERTSP